MTDSSVNQNGLARSGTEAVANSSGTLSQSSTSEDTSIHTTATVVVDVETHNGHGVRVSPSESEAQINITINPADVRLVEGQSLIHGGTPIGPHLSTSVVNDNFPATVSTSSESQSGIGGSSGNINPSDSQQSNATPTLHSSAASSAPQPPEMNGNSNNSSSRGPAGGSSSSRRQRNGLFGINIDLNFDPSWLVPSNVAGWSISSLSVLPDWVRHTGNIIPNRGGDNSSNSESSGRQSQAAHGSSFASSSGAGSRLLSHYHQAPSTPNWNSSFAPGGGSGSYPNMQHTVPLRTRHAVTAIRSVDEDLDADYNPVSTLDIGAAGRDRANSSSYVINMDGPGDWGMDNEGPSTSQVRGGGALSESVSSSSDMNNASGSPSGGNGISDNAGGARRSVSEIGVATAVGGAGGGGGIPDGGGSPSMADATTAANERTRAAEILRDAPETRAFINEISRYTTIRPFLVICFLKGVFDHGTSILAFLALIVTFSHANSMVKKEVSKQKKRNLLYLSMIVINLAACVAFIYYIFNEMGLHYALGFLPVSFEINNFWSLIWVVAVTDYVAKFVTVFIKIIIVSLPGCIVPFQKRGKFYLFIEHTSQIYRSFIPVHPWLFYLVSSYEGTAAMFGFLLAGMYLFFKITDSIGRFKEWFKALEKLLSNVHYGTNPTTKELNSAGSICPICHDNYVSPTRLACTHIFCEECVATWFDRERTCPMCRAKVVDDPTYRDGSTSQYVQLF